MASDELTAADARELSETAPKADVSEVLKLIRAAASEEKRSCWIQRLTPRQEAELQRRGFKVEGKGNQLDWAYEVSW